MRRTRLRPSQIAALGSALLAVGGVLAAWAFFSTLPRDQGAPQSIEGLQERAANHIRKAHEHIAAGHFALALEQFDALAALARDYAGVSVDGQWLAQQRHEIGLYADLLPASLEELLAEAIDLPEAEWQHHFAKRYKGKAVLLDVAVTRHEAGNLTAAYKVAAGGQEATIDLGIVAALAGLPAGVPKRVLFGGRLHELQRVQPGAWVIRFEAKSVALLTDAEALIISCPALDDAGTRAVLAAQALLR